MTTDGKGGARGILAATARRRRAVTDADALVIRDSTMVELRVLDGLDDTLNLGFGLYKPPRGIVAEVLGDVFVIALEEDAGPDGPAPRGMMKWRDAYVSAEGLHETEEGAWDAYNEAVAEARRRSR